MYNSPFNCPFILSLKMLYRIGLTIIADIFKLENLNVAAGCLRKIFRIKSFNQYSEQFKFRLPKSLHRSLAEHAKREGVSMNQYCVYLLSRNDALQSEMYYTK